MGKVACEISISAGGFSDGPDQTEERPFGEDEDDQLLRAWHAETREENQAEADQIAAASASVMGAENIRPSA